LSTGKERKADALAEMRRMVKEQSGTLDTEEAFKTLLAIFKREEDSPDVTPQRRLELLAKRQEYGRRLLGAQADKLELSEAWRAWEESPLKRNPGKKTREGYFGEWKRFSGWATAKGLRHLHEVNAAHVEEYAGNLWASGVTPGTYNAHVKFLKSLFRCLKNRAGLVANPWELIPTKNNERESRRAFTPEELATICGRATGSLRYMLGLGLYTGLRLGDIVCLRWADVNFDAAEISVLPMKTRRLRKKITIPMHPVVTALLHELRATETGEYLFPADRADYVANVSTITKRIQGFFESCGIKTLEDAPEDAQRKRRIIRVGFHSLRHSFVSLCAANRVPKVAIQELVGHGSPAMTDHYSHAGRELKQDAIAALPEMTFKNGDAKQ